MKVSEFILGAPFFLFLFLPRTLNHREAIAVCVGFALFHKGHLIKANNAFFPF